MKPARDGVDGKGNGPRTAPSRVAIVHAAFEEDWDGESTGLNAPAMPDSDWTVLADARDDARCVAPAAGAGLPRAHEPPEGAREAQRRGP